MTVSIVCPACRQATAIYRAPSECPRCYQRLPAELVAVTTDALARAEFPKPLPLRVGQFASAAIGGTILAWVFTPPGTSFELEARFAFTIVALALIAIYVGLWRERPWARPLMAAFWFLVCGLMVALSDSPAASVFPALIWLAVTYSLSSWYLYGTDAVTAYYLSIARTDAAVDTSGHGA